MLRYLTAGESHGRALGVIVEGLPAGLEVTVEDVSSELARRRLGFGRGPRQRFERDELSLVGGVRHGRTLGGPVLIEVPNPEWPKWEQEMSPAPGEPSKRLTAPRPGHADLAAMQKYGYDDARDALERASARETAARVAAGALAKLLLRRIGIEIVSHVVAMGGVTAPAGDPAHARPISTRWTPRPCAASTPGRARPWWPPSRRRPSRATASAASSRWSPTASRSVWAATSTGTASSTPSWPSPS